MINYRMGASPTDLVTNATTTKKETDLLRYYKCLRMIQLNVRKFYV